MQQSSLNIIELLDRTYPNSCSQTEAVSLINDLLLNYKFFRSEDLPFRVAAFRNLCGAIYYLSIPIYSANPTYLGMLALDNIGFLDIDKSRFELIESHVLRQIEDILILWKP